jgi:hypothetical protein
VTAHLAYLALQPSGIDVAPDADVVVTARLLDVGRTFALDTLALVVDGVPFFETADGLPRVLRDVAYGGYAVAGTTLTVRARPRRPFLYSVNVAVTGQLAVNDADPEPFSFGFTVRNAPRTLRDPSLRATRVDAPLSRMALDTYRRALLAGLAPTGAPSAVLALYRAVATTELRAVLYLVPLASGAAREGPAGASARATLDAVADDLARLAPLWDLALGELRGAGVERGVVDLVARAGAAPSGASRVAAACLAVLLGAQKDLDAGA